MIEDVLRKRKVLITCGTGGVGKTTLSAALGIRAAQMGLKTVVVTIDPAKRLATALGFRTLADEPTPLTERLEKILEKKIDGTLDAIVPDTRKTFEAFVLSLTDSPETAQKVFDNPIFQIFAKEHSGANEYMALKRLHALHDSGKYDLIILDTPPSRNSLDFFEAPQLLSRFFDEKYIHWLVESGGSGWFSTGVHKALDVLGKLTGSGFIASLVDFASALYSVREAFQRSLAQVTQLLESTRTGYLLVTTPNPENVPDMGHLIDALDNRGLCFDGILMNRSFSAFQEFQSPHPSVPAWAAAPPYRDAWDVVHSLWKREQQVLHDLTERAAPTIRARLPELARDAHSLEDLLYVAQALG